MKVRSAAFRAPTLLNSIEPQCMQCGENRLASACRRILNIRISCEAEFVTCAAAPARGEEFLVHPRPPVTAGTSAC